MTIENTRLQEARERKAPWRKWGPYHGRRPVYGGMHKFQDTPHWRDLHQFYEYFHGDSGAGLGANHQTGWTGIIARMMHLFATTSAEQLLSGGKAAAMQPARHQGR